MMISKMLKQSFLVAAVGVNTLVLNIFVSRIISEKRINITRVKQHDSVKLSAMTVAGIEIAETIKSAGAENGFSKNGSDIKRQ